MEHAFPCGDPSLDFVGTLRARRNKVPFDMLRSPASLDAWFRESGVADAGTGCRPSDVREAVILREAIYSLVMARMRGENFEEGALALVNRAARTPPAVPQLTPVGRRIEATPAQAMSTVARDAIDMVSGQEAPLLKECANPECTQVYVDHSRGARREWCAMDSCGNKMKAAAYRARKRGTRPVSVPLSAGAEHPAVRL
jgi:predicted RNA-binding Zn ribbon-like protein